MVLAGCHLTLWFYVPCSSSYILSDILTLFQLEGADYVIHISVSSVVEFPGAGSSSLRTINSELSGAT